LAAKFATQAALGLRRAAGGFTVATKIGTTTIRGGWLGCGRATQHRHATQQYRHGGKGK
jgi:hypothetical protein